MIETKMKHFIEVIKSIDILLSKDKYSDLSEDDIISIILLNYQDNGTISIEKMIKKWLKEVSDDYFRKKIERKISKQTKKLMNKDLVTKCKYEEDKRKVIVHLTEKSYSILSYLESLIKQRKEKNE